MTPREERTRYVGRLQGRVEAAYEGLKQAQAEMLQGAPNDPDGRAYLRELGEACNEPLYAIEGIQARLFALE